MEEQLKSIIKDKQLPHSMDYRLLRKEAIATSQQISGDGWTDYNIHDPGVTILEQFCYALTEIAYRTNLSIETLLFHGGNQDKVGGSNALYPPQDVFPTNPITLSDYRILILDYLPNKISNCWVNAKTDHKEGIQGLYDITLLLKSDVGETEYEGIKKDVRSVFVSYRNLCEDVNEIKILKPEKISLSAEIDIYQDESAEQIFSELLFEVESYFNPPIHFASLEELQEQGKNLDQIFDTPSFTHGFITQEQLSPKPKEFYVSKIADHILDVKGVRGLRNLTVLQDGIPVHGDTINVEDDKYLTLGLLNGDKDSDAIKGFDITILKGGVVNNYLWSAVIYSLEIKEAKSNRSYEIQTRLTDQHKTKINTSELLSYESVQNSFPGIYGVGDYTPAKEEGNLRLAQSSQLKAYLLFFDQLMANHLAQISKLSELFSIDNVDTHEIRTYYTQILDNNISGVSDLLKRKVPAKSSLLKRKEALQEGLSSLNDKEKQELNSLNEDIKAKDVLVNQLVKSRYQALLKLPLKELKKSRLFQNREIIEKLIELKKLEDESKEEDSTGEDIKISLIGDIQAMMAAELEEEEHDIDLDQRHLDLMMLEFDHSYERKNRILSHLLGRFGEKFTTDFHIKFSSLMDGESQENIDKKLIRLKSAFLKEIVKIGRFRSKATNYLVTSNIWDEVPLKRKVALLLDLHVPGKDGLASKALTEKLRVKSLTGADIETDTKDNNQYLVPKKSENKITFLINSSYYYTYLFKYGLKETNYSIEKEKNEFVVYFKPPTEEMPTRLFQADSKVKAHQQIESIVVMLRQLNAKSEGFHILEHILLRPLDNNDCYFNIKSKSDTLIFKSKDAQPEDTQKKLAVDTILLGCYLTNYQVLQNPKKEYVVIIKNGVGVELAKSINSFLTEVGAQQFIEECIEYFNLKKEDGEFENLYELDNQKEYLFDILDDKGELLFESIEALSIVEQEKRVEDLIIFTTNPACYITKQRSNNNFAVVLTDYENNELAWSQVSFTNPNDADVFIQNCIQHFENIGSKSAYKSIVRFRRVDGRKADDFNAQMSVVYSAWSSRFHNQEFLQLFKQTLFNCAPAHIAINMVGLHYQEMKKFEMLYAQYMKEFAIASHENQEIRTRLSNELLDILTE